MQGGPAFPVTERNLQRQVSWPRGAQFLEATRRGLDIHAAPASIVEGARDRVMGGILCAHIEVKTVLDIVQRSPKENVFAVLGIGNNPGGWIFDTQRYLLDWRFFRDEQGNDGQDGRA